MKKVGVANLLTLFRVICIPIFVFFFVLQEYGITLIVFFAAAVSDMIDGTVARLMKEKSQFGALLDPLADKICMLTVFISLAVIEVVPWWFIAVILVRDVVVVAGFIFVKVNQIPFKYRALWSSKIATFFETVAGVFALVSITYPNSALWGFPMWEVTFGSILVASILIFIAAMQYLKLGMQLLENRFGRATSDE